MNSGTRISAQGLMVGRQSIPIAGPLDFVVSSGTCLVVTGPNGSGKSTLLQTLAGSLAPCGGSLGMPSGPRLYLPQLSAEQDDIPLTVHEVIRTILTSKSRIKKVVMRACEQVGLQPTILNQRWSQLSGGERQRVNLVRLLVCDAKVALLDEPTSAIDRASLPRLIQVCQEHLLETGLLFVVVTHHPEAWNQHRFQRLELSARETAEASE